MDGGYRIAFKLECMRVAKKGNFDSDLAIDPTLGPNRRSFSSLYTLTFPSFPVDRLPHYF